MEIGHCKFDANPLSVDICVRAASASTPVALLVTRNDLERVQIRVNETGRIHVRVPHGYRGDLNLYCFGDLDVEVSSWDFGAVDITCGGAGVLKLGRLQRLSGWRVETSGSVATLRS